MSGARMLAMAAGVSTALLLATGAPVAADDGPFDILGFKLGMTVDEAKAALKDFGAANLSEQDLHYGYSDGVNNNLQTDDFVFYIAGGKDSFEGYKRRSDGITLVFSPPPGEQRVVAIVRNYENRISPPTTDEFRSSLVEKYGTPSETPYGKQAWYFPDGKVNCIAGGYSPLGMKDILKSIFQGAQDGRPGSPMQNPAAKSLDDCANSLEYSGSPVPAAPATNVSATMMDVQGWARATIAANDWVEGLRQEAIRKRQGGASKPVL